jgi:ligand-binding SRPBCC domain-containing protein
MKTFYYNASQLLPINMDEAWKFFSSAKNLAVITPQELDFKILSTLDGKEIYEGMLIDYTVKPLFGIPVRWQTEIYKVNKPSAFTDRQLRGPYKVWEHTHRFFEKENGVLMEDEVKYQLPFGIIGEAVNSILVQKKIKEIFDFRREILMKILKKNGSTN